MLPRYEVRRLDERDRAATTARASRYTSDEIREAIRRWARRYGLPPTSTDWEPARARRMGQPWRAARFEAGEWPTVRMVRGRFGSFNAAVRAAGLRPRTAPTRLRPNLTGPDAIVEAIV